jgi:hypothetical protein
MARTKVAVGALNIRLHPHQPGTYERFLKAIYVAKKPIRLRGDRMAVIRSLNTSSNPEDFLFGVITTYLQIDVNQPWFNDDTFDVATPEDLEEIVLPKNLHPNIKSFLFALDTKNHRIYFEYYSNGNVFTHRSALAFFEGSANQPSILKAFNGAKITIVQSKLSLDTIFSIRRITSVKIYIEKDNDIWPDDFEDHLEQKNARSITVEYKSEQGLSIIRDDDIQAAAEASLELGYTEVSGYDDDGHKKLSTKSFPKLAQEKFDKGMYTAVSMFREVINQYRRR